MEMGLTKEILILMSSPSPSPSPRSFVAGRGNYGRWPMVAVNRRAPGLGGKGFKLDGRGKLCSLGQAVMWVG